MITPEEQKLFNDRFTQYIKKYVPEWEQYLKTETYQCLDYLLINIPVRHQRLLGTLA